MQTQDAPPSGTAAEEVAGKMAGIRATADAINAAEAPATESTLPAWLIDADAEEQRELEALGVVIDPTFQEEAQRDVLVSSLLRARHEHEQDVERYDAAEKLEHDRIAQRYGRLKAPAQRQLMRLAAFLVHIINQATFTGKNKSRNVGWGSYGRRMTPAKVDITNMPELVSGMRVIDPKAVKVTVTVNAELVEHITTVITDLMASGKLTGGVYVSAVSELRAALAAGDSSVSKTDVARLLKQENPPVLPGVVLVPGVDKPWFEVEAPANV